MELKTTVAGDDWLAAPPALSLGDGEMHLWQADASGFARHESRLTGLLSKAEIDKAQRFRNSAQRDRSLLARAVLRDILGRYTDSDPRSLQFLVSRFGKPRLDPQRHAEAPHFNLSHSGNLVLFAFTRKYEVGVDVEAVRGDVDAVDLARRFFAPTEVKDLLSLPEDSRLSAFFAVWTRKEAYLKARAQGIGSGLQRFAVSVLPAEPVRLLSDERFPHAPSRWHLSTVTLGAGFAASTAVCCDGLRPRYWRW